MNMRLTGLHALLVLMCAACANKAGSSSRSPSSMGSVDGAPETNPGNDYTNDDDTTTTVDDSDTSTNTTCVPGSLKIVRADTGTQVYASLATPALKNFVVTGIGARAEDNQAKGIYVEMKEMWANGAVNDSNKKTLRFGDIASNSAGQKYISLPSGYMATGFGFSVAENGQGILAARIAGVRVGSDGSVYSHIECMMDRNLNTRCAAALSLTGDSANGYSAFTADDGFILKSFGLGISSGKVRALWAQVTPISVNGSCH